MNKINPNNLNKNNDYSNKNKKAKRSNNTDDKFLDSINIQENMKRTKGDSSGYMGLKGTKTRFEQIEGNKNIPYVENGTVTYVQQYGSRTTEENLHIQSRPKIGDPATDHTYLGNGFTPAGLTMEIVLSYSTTENDATANFKFKDSNAMNVYDGVEKRGFYTVFTGVDQFTNVSATTAITSETSVVWTCDAVLVFPRQ